ncbi:MAG: MgtC/SapB family protein [Bacillota bacterium]|nr:MgtC/SapB family protein [Bacillota bacterium]
MGELIQMLHEMNIVSVAFRLLLAAVLAGVVGMERESHGRVAGFRTHILVGVGSAMAVLVGLYATEVLGLGTDPLRVGAQVLSGIGFLGAGTILVKSTAKVKGLTTAAGLWCMAAIGLACGIGFYSGALIGTALSLVTVALLSKMEGIRKEKQRLFNFYLEVEGAAAVNPLVEILNQGDYLILELGIHPARTTLPGQVGLQITLRVRNALSEEEIIRYLLSISGVKIVLVLK